MEHVLFHFFVYFYFLGFILAVLVDKEYVKNFRVLGTLKLRAFLDFVPITMPRIILPFLAQPKISLPLWITLSTGAGLFTFSMILYFFAFKELGGFQPKEKKLIKGGVYGLIRHPMYLAEMLWPIDWAIAFGALWASLVAPFFSTYFIYLLLEEEKELAALFGEEYREYEKHVPRFLPKISLRFSQKERRNK